MTSMYNRQALQALHSLTSEQSMAHDVRETKRFMFRVVCEPKAGRAEAYC